MLKRLLCAALLLIMAFTVCACSKTSVDSDAQVELCFIYGDQNIRVLLPDTEAQEVIRILDGKSYDSIFDGVASCGFDENISFKVDGRTYAIARDTCNTLQDMGNLRYFSVSQADMAYIHTLFEEYGGHFPCV